MYWWGRPEKDVKKAIHLYKLAADKGDKDAQHALGFAYRYGHGLTVDFSKAIKDLDHNPIIDPHEGIKRTTEWMKSKYGICHMGDGSCL